MTTGIGGVNSNSCLATSNDNSKTSSSGNVTMAQIMQKLLDNFAKSYAKTSESTEDQQKKQMVKDLLSKADTDKDGALSMDELKSVDTKGDAQMTNLVSELMSSFKTLDQNSDGELSLKEMEVVAKRKAFSAQELAQMFKKGDNSNSFGTNALSANSSGNLSSLMADKLVSSYDAVSLS